MDICICISSDFELQKIWVIYYRSMNPSPIFGHQLNSMGCNHHSHKCAFMEKLGNLEVEIERIGGNMDQEQNNPPIWNKTLYEAPKNIFEWPIPWKNWMRISLSWNWLTSSVSVHSTCNGQASALQMPKANSQMIKIHLHSSWNMFLTLIMPFKVELIPIWFVHLILDV